MEIMSILTNDTFSLNKFKGTTQIVYNYKTLSILNIGAHLAIKQSGRTEKTKWGA